MSMFKKKTLKNSSDFVPQVVDEVPATTSVERVQGVVRDIGHNAVTSRAEQIRHQTDEGMIWQASPSLTLLVFPAIVAVVVFLATSIGAKIAQDELLQVRERAAAQGFTHTAPARTAKGLRPRPLQQPAVASDEEVARIVGWIGRIPYVFGALLALVLFWRFLVLKTTRYAATSQRLIIEKGVFLTRSTPHELHDLGDFVIEKPLDLRPFGIGRLRIVGKRVYSNSVVKSMQMPVMIGIRNPEYVRDILRTGGQLEAQRIDKVRWR